METVNTISPGEYFVAHPSFRAFYERKTATASTSSSGGFAPFSVNIPLQNGSNRVALTEQVRATLTTSGLTSIQKFAGVVELGVQPPVVTGLFTQSNTTQSTIRICKESSITNAATAVAEEGLKPEATFALEEVDFPVRKYGVVARVTDETAQDFPAVVAHVNSRLIYSVDALISSDCINGAGGSSITGILATSGIQTEAAAASANIADAIHRAITKIQNTVGFLQPTAVLMHPTDWQTMALTRDSVQQYYAGGPFVGPYGQQIVNRYNVWGLPVMVTTDIAQGTALVGDFIRGGMLFNRSLELSVTNSDGSDFVYNRLCIRAERRVALVIERPRAFCKITGIN